jgi:hypothetical protein
MPFQLLLLLLLLLLLQVSNNWSFRLCRTCVFLFFGLWAHLWQHDNMARIWESVFVYSESCVTRNWSIGSCQLSIENSIDFHTLKTLDMEGFCCCNDGGFQVSTEFSLIYLTKASIPCSPIHDRRSWNRFNSLACNV